MATALDDGDPALIAAVLGDIARAQGMTKIARKTGLGRESLYKTLSNKGNPELATILKVLSAVGLKLQAIPGSGARVGRALRARRWRAARRRRRSASLEGGRPLPPGSFKRGV